MESVPENLSGTSSAMRAYPLISADPLWRKIRKPEPRKVFVAKTREEKPVRLYPIAADHTPHISPSKGDLRRKPDEPRPGLQGDEEIGTFAYRNRGEMGFVGGFGGRLPRMAGAVRSGAQYRSYRRIRGDTGTGLKRGIQVAAGGRRGATRVQRGCYAVATARKCCNRVAADGAWRGAKVWRPGEIGGEIGLFIRFLVRARPRTEAKARADSGDGQLVGA